MAIEWVTPAGNLITAIEESDITKVYIEYTPSDAELITYVNGVETLVADESYNPTISGKLPEGIMLKKVRDGRYSLEGKLPIVNGETVYYFTLRVRLLVNGEYEYSDRYFSITVQNKATTFKTPDIQPFEFIESVYTSYQIELNNPIGNEEFVKISGKIPAGVFLSSNGLLYGVAIEPNDEAQIYNFVVGIRRNDEIILEKEFTATVIKLNTIDKPVWITESGVIGSIKYHDSIFDEMAVKAFDPKGGEIVYSIVEGYRLPDGLELDISTGQIRGTCRTKTSRTWDFKIAASNLEHTVERDFSIITNEISGDEYLEWITNEELGTYKVGDIVYITLECDSKYNVKYRLVSNELPSGLSLKNGIIVGTLKYQPEGAYQFTIAADNGFSYITKTFSFTVAKGFGKNALKCYLYFNHEYEDDYGEMKGYFNKNYAYNTSNPKYQIGNIPEINICQCSCFDKLLMQHLLHFSESLDLYWGKTVQKRYYEDDKEKYSVFHKSFLQYLENGGAKSWSGNRVYVTPSNQSSTGYYLEGTTKEVVVTGNLYSETDLQKQGAEYIIYKNRKTYIRRLTTKDYYRLDNLYVLDGEEVFFESYIERDPYTFVYEVKSRPYILDGEDKVYVAKAENNMLMNAYTRIYLELNADTAEILRDNNTTRQYFIENRTTTIDYPSIDGIRESLSQRIYVSKNLNDNVLYDLSSQRVIAENADYPEYTICYDEERNEYYAKREGENIYLDVYAKSDDEEEVKRVYAKVENQNWHQSIDNKYASTTEFENEYNNMYAPDVPYKYLIDGNMTRFLLVPVYTYVEYLNTDVDYHSYYIYEKGTDNLQEGILFSLEWKPECKFIILNGVVHHVGLINKPWMYIESKNETINFGYDIVLPYISDEDVFNPNTNAYIRMFDPIAEVIPEWKTREIPDWQPDYEYSIGDVFTYMGYYYGVKQAFKSGSTFEILDDYIFSMSQAEVAYYKTPRYYPTLDLFYGLPHTGVVSDESTGLQALNNEESKGFYWTGRKFCFYEVHFQPLYNNNIDNFSIVFYNENNSRSPHFQLI